MTTISCFHSTNFFVRIDSLLQWYIDSSSYFITPILRLGFHEAENCELKAQTPSKLKLKCCPKQTVFTFLCMDFPSFWLDSRELHTNQVV